MYSNHIIGERMQRGKCSSREKRMCRDIVATPRTERERGHLRIVK